MNKALRLALALVVFAAVSADALTLGLKAGTLSRAPVVAAFQPGKVQLSASSFSGLARVLPTTSVGQLSALPTLKAEAFVPAFAPSAGRKIAALSPLLSQKGPLEFRLPGLFDGAFRLEGDEVDGSRRSFRLGQLSWPNREESDRINDGRWQNSPIGADLERTARSQGVQYAVDRQNRADHGESIVYQDRPMVALTKDTLNASWAFIQAIKAREHSWFYPWYSDIPASAEKLAVNYGHMALVFAQLTNSSSRRSSWATNLDHDHDGNGKYYMWEWYRELLKAVAPGADNVYPSFFGSTFFSWLRDYTANQLSDDVSYQYSLYERYTGRYYRPGQSVHEQELPANVPRLGEDEYQKATRKFYGADGEGDGNSDQNFLGFVRKFFQARGNR